MAQIILTIPGPWTSDPGLDTRPFSHTFGEAIPGLVDEMAEMAAPTEAFEKAELRALRKHTGVLFVTGPVAEGDLAPAKAAARLMVDAFAAGALGAYVETAGKVISPKGARGLNPTDPPTLFHLFVEVFRDADRAVTEGMQAFGLRDVEVPFSDEPGAKTAQAAAFGLAAKMVCDGVRPAAGHPFKASESAPLYRVFAGEPEPMPEGDEALFVNPLGRWCLKPV
jgi:hypothetical protein